MQLLALTLLMIAPTNAPTNAPVESERIAGIWEARGSVSGGSGGAIGWSKRYVFKPDGTYTFDAYPQMHRSGTWMLRKVGVTYLLEMNAGPPTEVVFGNDQVTMGATAFKYLGPIIGIDALAGHWRFEEGSGYFIDYVFAKDGTGTLSASYMKEPYAMQWKIAVCDVGRVRVDVTGSGTPMETWVSFDGKNAISFGSTKLTRR